LKLSVYPKKIELIDQRKRESVEILFESDVYLENIGVEFD